MMTYSAGMPGMTVDAPIFWIDKGAACNDPCAAAGRGAGSGFWIPCGGTAMVCGDAASALAGFPVVEPGSAMTSGDDGADGAVFDFAITRALTGGTGKRASCATTFVNRLPASTRAVTQNTRRMISPLFTFRGRKGDSQSARNFPWYFAAGYLTAFFSSFACTASLSSMPRVLAMASR